MCSGWSRQTKDCSRSSRAARRRPRWSATSPSRSTRAVSDPVAPITMGSSPAASGRPSAARRRCLNDRSPACRLGLVLELPRRLLQRLSLHRQPSRSRRRHSSRRLHLRVRERALRRRLRVGPRAAAGRRGLDARGLPRPLRDLSQRRRSAGSASPHPFIAVWDDHESANDAWSGGAANHDPRQGSWATRRPAPIARISSGCRSANRATRRFICIDRSASAIWPIS